MLLENFMKHETVRAQEQFRQIYWNEKSFLQQFADQYHQSLGCILNGLAHGFSAIGHRSEYWTRHFHAAKVD